MMPDNIAESREAFARLQAMYDRLKRPIRILLVEDDLNDVALVKSVLTGYRLEITHGLTVSESIKLIDNGGEFDLCLLDLKMPDRPGREMLQWARDKHIRSDDKFPAVKFLFTGNISYWLALQPPL